MSVSHHLAAIMFTDIAGYTAIMQENEEKALKTVNRHEEILEPSVKKHNGKVIQYYGDGSLSIFKSATDAVSSALEIQKQTKTGILVPLRIGIHIGEIITEKDKVFGDGVNLASRIESIGQPGSILFSSNVQEKIKNNTEFKIKSLGSFEFKNVKYPMEVFALANEGITVPKAESIEGKLKKPVQNRNGKKIRIGVFAGLAVIIFALAYIAFNIKTGTGPDLIANLNKTPNSIAVLPFDSYSDIPDQVNFAKGMADELRTQLLSINNLKVISRTSSILFKEKKLSLKQIRNELNVGYILEGTVQYSEDNVKVSVQLSNTDSEKMEWSNRPYEQKLDNLFLIQNEIAKEIVDQLKVELSETEKDNLDKIWTENIQAYNYFQKAGVFNNKNSGTKEDLDMAVEFYQKAIKEDPNFVRAYVGLSDTYLNYIFWGRAPAKEILDKALTAAFKALELDSEEGSVYGTLGAINFYRFEKESSVQYLEKALELSPNYVTAYEKLAWLKVFEGDYEGALKMFEKALELDPLSVRLMGTRSYVYYFSREYQEGLKVIDDALEISPEYNFLLWIKGNLYAGMGDFEKAIESFGGRTVGTNNNWMLGYSYGMNGETEKAQAILDYLLEKKKTVHVPSYMIAVIYIGLKDYDSVIEWLKKDFDEGGQGLFIWALGMDPRFDPLKEDPRFQELVDRIKI